jgi:hypothetical protein
VQVVSAELSVCAGRIYFCSYDLERIYGRAACQLQRGRHSFVIKAAFHLEETHSPPKVANSCFRSVLSALLHVDLRFHFLQFSYSQPTMIQNYQMENSRSKHLISFRLYTILIYMMNSHAVPSILPGT